MDGDVGRHGIGQTEIVGGGHPVYQQTQLVATGVLLQMGQLAPQGIAAAVDTASKQGWRRPLLAWLGVQLQRADAAGDTEAKARIQRRIDLVSDVMTGSQPANR